MKTYVAFLSAALLLVSATVATASMEAEVAAYQTATKDICQTGLANGSEAIMAVRYDQLAKAMERDGVGFGRGNNFWGPTQPVLLFDYCHQSGDSG
jgi:hypothetical protein